MHQLEIVSSLPIVGLLPYHHAVRLVAPHNTVPLLMVVQAIRVEDTGQDIDLVVVVREVLAEVDVAAPVAIDAEV